MCSKPKVAAWSSSDILSRSVCSDLSCSDSPCSYSVLQLWPCSSSYLWYKAERSAEINSSKRILSRLRKNILSFSACEFINLRKIFIKSLILKSCCCCRIFIISVCFLLMSVSVSSAWGRCSSLFFWHHWCHSFPWWGRNDSLISLRSFFSSKLIICCAASLPLLQSSSSSSSTLMSECLDTSSSPKVEDDCERQSFIVLLSSSDTSDWLLSFKPILNFPSFISITVHSSSVKRQMSGFLFAYRFWIIVAHLSFLSSCVRRTTLTEAISVRICSCFSWSPASPCRLQNATQSVNLSVFFPAGQNQAISTTPSIRTLVLLLPGQFLWKNVLCFSLIRLFISWDLDEDTEPDLKKNTIGVSAL